MYIIKKKQTEEALQNYINILSHDLRSPLTSIIGYSSFLLEDEPTKDELKKYSSIIKKNGEKMLKMIESYLSLSKIERGKDLLGKKLKKIGELIDEINKNFLVLMGKKKIKILFKDLKNKNIHNSLMNKNILIDEILIYSAVNNLLHNAMDASINLDDNITINIYDLNNELHISFYNKGEISKKVEKKLFKKFVSTKKNGTGIGLYSARLIARAHGGDVIYQPVLGGTRFLFKIPIN
ncbi:MAG: HAMP domain-containing sensor histidine kinase [Candidatus Paceibacterota bacterium]